MKFLYFLLGLAMLPSFCLADAGFNIRRPKAPCFAVFTGIDQLPGYEFFKISKEDKGIQERINDSSFRLYDNDTLEIYYSEGRRYWQGPVKILVRDKASQQFVDSFTVSAEGYNLAVHFNPAGNNPPTHSISKTQAEYPYNLYTGEKVDTATAKRNKYILIAMSALGFLLLFFLVFKRKNNSENKIA